MSDRICLMRDGGIEQLGTPAELYFKPQTVFAADFFGGANIFGGIAEPGGGLRLADGTAVRCGSAPTRSGPQSFMVRAEHLRPLEPGEASENETCCLLEQVVIAGPVTRYHGRLRDGGPVTAVRLTEGPELAAHPGETIRLGWTAGRTVLLADGRAA